MKMICTEIVGFLEINRTFTFKFELNHFLQDYLLELKILERYGAFKWPSIYMYMLFNFNACVASS